MSTQLWPGGPVYTGEPVWTDSLVLSDFASVSAPLHCADLGCGDGILLLLLSSALPEAHIDGVDFCREAVQNCRINIADNCLQERCTVREEDLRTVSLLKNSYDMVVSNPPYFLQGSGAVSPKIRNSLSRVETATLPELCASAASLLKNGGRFCIVHRPERLQSLMTALESAGLYAKRLRFVCSDQLHKPSLFLCEARKGSKPGLDIMPSLFLHNADGGESSEYLKITHYNKS